MFESNLTPEEQDELQKKLNEEELDIPPEERKSKKAVQEDLTQRLKNRALAGGTYSTLNPMKPNEFKELGEPTVSLKKEGILQPSKN